MFKTIKLDYDSCLHRVIPFFIIFMYRLGNYTYYSSKPKIIKKPILLFLRIIQKLLIEPFYHVELPFKAKIGKGIRINHPYNIIINECAIIGDNCTIYHEVTIGMNEHETGEFKSPHIGDNVYIGCGAKIIGGISIGNNVIIGAGTIIAKSVKDDCTVVGGSVRIFS